MAPKTTLWKESAKSSSIILYLSVISNRLGLLKTQPITYIVAVGSLYFEGIIRPPFLHLKM
jgi:hypothetical protein